MSAKLVENVCDWKKYVFEMWFMKILSITSAVIDACDEA